MILFEMIEFFGVINKKWTISKPITTLDTLIQFMDKFHFNAIQLGANPTQFLFYHPDGERYGLCDLRTLSSSSTKFKGVQLHQMNEEDIDERVKTFNIYQAELGIEISLKKKKKKTKPKK
ncbi:unnamed protein product [Rotaria socialis]|nr:unnamed protein product [Rotaria socialis]CAF3309545.1 unnamed protein product [Rotaria socialis]CAF4661582.1 unnamed protein product [Rotaria socialis]